jgi:cyclase
MAPLRRIRVIPTLLVRDGDLVKTRRFSNPIYIGDPINAVRIFNDKGADELVLLDISAAGTGQPMAPDRLVEITSEAFMPLAYGGGIATLAHVDAALRAGVEKVVINSAAAATPSLITDAAKRFGSQSIVVSIDVVPTRLGGKRVVTHRAKRSVRLPGPEHARRMVDAGAGELFVTAVAREGTFAGYDLPLLRAISDAVQVPVIACGGAASIDDMALAVREGGASAVAAGSMFVFQGRHRAVLINYPTEHVLREQLFSRVT